MIEQLINNISTGFFQEFVLIIGIFLYIMLSIFLRKYFYKISKWASIAVITATVLSMQKIQIIPAYYAFNGTFMSNFYTVFLKAMILMCTFFIILMSKNMIIKKRSKVFDFFTLILLATLGAMCTVSANDFITLFVSAELLGISSYLLTTFSKTFNSKEAGFKYITMGTISTLVMLFGVSYLYMATGSLNFDFIYSVLTETSEISPFINIGCVLCALGLTFKMGLIPFSNWLPDIFEGTSDNIAGFISLVPLFAGFGILSRLIVFIFQYTPMVQALLIIIGILSVYKGFLGLIRQDNLRRFMGYSAIAQSGFILIGFCISNPFSVSTSLFYMISYILMSVGLWSAIILFSHVTKKNTIPDLKGLVYSSKSFSLVMAICLLSYAGLPVTAGFLAKIYLFLAIAQCSKLYLLFLIILMFGSVIGIYGYIRPIREMFYRAENNFYKNPKFNSLKLTLYVCSILTIILCVFPDKIIQICQFVAYQL